MDHVLAPYVAQQLQERQRRDDVLFDLLMVVAGYLFCFDWGWGFGVEALSWWVGQYGWDGGVIAKD